MTPGDETFEAMMAELRQEFLDRLQSDARAIEAAWAAAQNPAGRAEELQTLAALAHRLAGLGRTFGHPAVTDCGLAVEAAAEKQLKAGGDLSPELADSVTALRCALSAASPPS